MVSLPGRKRLDTLLKDDEYTNRKQFYSKWGVLSGLPASIVNIYKIYINIALKTTANES